MIENLFEEYLLAETQKPFFLKNWKKLIWRMVKINNIHKLMDCKYILNNS